MMQYGENLLKYIPDYKDDYGSITYKPDYMTAQGTAATGQKVNHLYKLYLKKQYKSEN